MAYQRKRDGMWIGEIRRGGVRRTETFPTKTQAKDWEADQRRGADSPATACGKLADSYLDWCALKFVERTVKIKRDILKHFFRSFRPTDAVETITPKAALAHLQGIAQTRTGHVANTHRTHLIAWWNWSAKFHGVNATCPFLKVDRFPARIVERHIPTMADFLRVLDFAQGQDKVLLLAYLHTAARRCELFRLTWADVDFSSKRIRLHTWKTRGMGARADWLDMTDELVAALLDWRRQNPDTIPVFHHDGKPYTTRHTWLPPLCRKAGVEPFGFHAIRHLTATFLANAGVPLPTISSILRHRAMSVTNRYLKNSLPQKEALKLLPFTKTPTERQQVAINTEDH